MKEKSSINTWIELGLKIQNDLYDYKEPTPTKVSYFDKRNSHLIGQYNHDFYGNIAVYANGDNFFFTAGSEQKCFALKKISVNTDEYIFNFDGKEECLFHASRLLVDKERNRLKLLPIIDNRNGTLTQKKEIVFTSAFLRNR